MADGQRRFFLPWLLGRIAADQPVEEKITHDEKTQVRIPDAQMFRAGLGISILALLFVAAWSSLPQSWSELFSWIVGAFWLIAVSLWGARISHGNSEFWQVVRDKNRTLVEVLVSALFTKQFWAFLGPLGIGLITLQMFSLPDSWWADNWGYAFIIAACSGPAMTAFLWVYLYSRETFVRFELTPWMEKLLRIMETYLGPAIEAELGVDVSGDRLERILDDFRGEIYDALEDAGRLDRIADQSTLQRDGRALANRRFQYDLLSFLWIAQDPEITLARNGWVDDRQNITTTGKQDSIILPSGLPVGYTEYTAIADTLAVAGIISRARKKAPKLNIDRLTREDITDIIAGLVVDKLPRQIQDHYYGNGST